MLERLTARQATEIEAMIRIENQDRDQTSAPQQNRMDEQQIKAALMTFTT